MQKVIAYQDRAEDWRRRASKATDAQEREADERMAAYSGSRMPTFVVVGGGPTGVELAGAIAELARHGLSRNSVQSIRPLRG